MAKIARQRRIAVDTGLLQSRHRERQRSDPQAQVGIASPQNARLAMTIPV
jgi:hypothetical protein